MKKCVVLSGGRVNCPVPTVWALSARSKISFYRAHVRAGFCSSQHARRCKSCRSQHKRRPSHTPRERERLSTHSDFSLLSFYKWYKNAPSCL